MDRLKGIEAFVRVAETQSFAEAARSLGVAPSVVTKRVQQLEQSLRAPLFHRTSRSVRLSDTGAAFLAECTDLLRHSAQLVDRMRERQEEPVGPLRVHALPGFALGALGPTLRTLALARQTLTAKASTTTTTTTTTRAFVHQGPGSRVVVYDPDLVRALPRAVRAASGLNAAAHAVEALYAKGVSPVVMHLAEDSVRRLARALPRIVAGDDDDDALADAGSPAVASAAPRWGCTTSSATPSVAPLASPTPRPTPSSCRTRWPTTRRTRPSPWRPSRAPSAQATPPGPCGTSAAAWASRRRCGPSACPKPASPGPPTG